MPDSGGFSRRNCSTRGLAGVLCCLSSQALHGDRISLNFHQVP